MQSNLASFIQVLRTHDLRISPAETLDAMTAAATLGYANRNLLRDGLAMTLAKTPEEEAVFLSCFDRFFSQELADFSMEKPGDRESQADPARECRECRECRCSIRFGHRCRRPGTGCSGQPGTA